MFQRHSISAFLTALITAGLLATPLAAATFSFTSAVTSSDGPSATPGVPSLPPVGTAGTIELVIDDSIPGLSIFDGSGDARIFASVSVDVPGWISGSMINNPNPADFLDISTSSFAFGAYGPTSVVQGNGDVLLPQGRHSFRVDFGAPVLSTPTTIGDLVTALSAPGASGFFSHELERDAGGFIFTRVEFPASTPEIPLPASAWLMIAGLAGLGLFRRRKTL